MSDYNNERWVCCGIYFGRFRDYAIHRFYRHPLSSRRRRELDEIIQKIRRTPTAGPYRGHTGEDHP